MHGYARIPASTRSSREHGTRGRESTHRRLLTHLAAVALLRPRVSEKAAPVLAKVSNTKPVAAVSFMLFDLSRRKGIPSLSQVVVSQLTRETLYFFLSCDIHHAFCIIV